MSCFMCYDFTGLGCEYCRDQLSAPTINCTHSPNDWRQPCDKCMYDGMRAMTEEEMLEYQVRQYKFIESISALTEVQNRGFSDETLKRLAQGVQDYNDSKVSEREWRKPSLWQRIKEMFR